MLVAKFKYHLSHMRVNAKRKLGVQPKKEKGIDVSILCYHGIVESNPAKYNSRFISLKEFEKHLAFLKTQDDIEVVSLERVLNNDLTEGKLNLVITFDDGYSNNLTYAVPVLKKYGFAASFCVNKPSDEPLWTDSIDILSHHLPEVSIDLEGEYTLGSDKQAIKTKLMKGNRETLHNYFSAVQVHWDAIKESPGVPYFWNRMTLDELNVLNSEPLFTVLPHGSKHLNLLELSDQDLKEEIESSIGLIQDITGSLPISYCPAFGYYDARVIKQAKELGVHSILGVDKTSLTPLHRLVIHPHISFDALKYYFYKGFYT